MNYKLSSDLFGHSLDVRTVAADANGCLISGSRDKTVKYWQPNETFTAFSNTATFTGHTNYVSSVRALPPSRDFPQGCILTGGNDKLICVYTLDNLAPVLSVKAHTNTVCCINPGQNSGSVLSCSWDCSAKLWQLSRSCLSQVGLFSGHQSAVWAVIQLSNGMVVTGASDKDIVMWSQSGEKKKTLKGHTDCVRDLAILNEGHFLSVANDATVILWSSEGTLINVMYGHSNFIYSISVNPAVGPDAFVTSGEDRTVKCWKNQECVQTITLPAQSVWCVTCLPNGDIATGSSDGLVRVFTIDESRTANPAALKAFEEEVNSMNVNSARELGGVKVADLPGKEVLYEPGKSDGQTKLVREGTTVVCYSWSMAKGEWNKIGDVMGASGGTNAASGKVLYEGKEYDFVFSVDIEDGKPPLKLPYNKDQDPWFAAQEFIHKNNLSQMFLDQVANFIITNSGPGQPIQQPAAAEYVDPFTGGSRYVPTNGTAAQTQAGANADPFTGSQSYVSNSSNSLPQSSNHFPQMSYVKLSQGNLTLISEKLKEFNLRAGEGGGGLHDSLLDEIVELASGPSRDEIYTDLAIKLLNWPPEMLFPILDVIRLAVRFEENNAFFCSGPRREALVTLLKKFTSPDCAFAANQMLAFRILVNLFSHQSGELFIFEFKEAFLKNINDLPFNLPKNTQVSAATFLLNLAVAIAKYKNSQMFCPLMDDVAKLLVKLNDSEAEYRCLVTIGTLLSQCGLEYRLPVVNTFKTVLDSFEKVIKLSSENPTVSNCSKNVYCAVEITKMLD